MIAFSEVDLTQTAANAILIVGAVAGFYRVMLRALDKKVDERIEPKLEQIHQRIDSHMNKEESQRKGEKRFKRKMMKEMQELRAQVNDVRTRQSLELRHQSTGTTWAESPPK